MKAEKKSELYEKYLDYGKHVGFFLTFEQWLKENHPEESTTSSKKEDVKEIMKQFHDLDK